MSYRELEEQLRRYAVLLDESSSRESTPAYGIREPRPTRRSRTALVGVAALVVLVGAIAVTWGGDERPEVIDVAVTGSVNGGCEPPEIVRVPLVGPDGDDLSIPGDLEEFLEEQGGEAASDSVEVMRGPLEAWELQQVVDGDGEVRGVVPAMVADPNLDPGLWPQIVPDLYPVTDEAGEVITGYWAQGVGFVETADVEAAGCDYKTLVCRSDTDQRDGRSPEEIGRERVPDFGTC